MELENAVLACFCFMGVSGLILLGVWMIQVNLRLRRIEQTLRLLQAQREE